MDDDVPVNSTTPAIASSSNTPVRQPRKSVFLGVFALSRPGEFDKAQAKIRAKEKAEKQQKQRQERAQAKEAVFASQRSHVKRKHDANDDSDSASSRESSFDAAGLVATAEPHARASTPARHTSATIAPSYNISSNAHKRNKPNSPAACADAACSLQGDERSLDSPKLSNNRPAGLSRTSGKEGGTGQSESQPVQATLASSHAGTSQQGDWGQTWNGVSPNAGQSLSEGQDVATVGVQEAKDSRQDRPLTIYTGTDNPHRQFSPELPSPPPSRPRKTVKTLASTAIQLPVRTIIISDSDSSGEEEQVEQVVRGAQSSPSAVRESVAGDSDDGLQSRPQQSSKHHQPLSIRKSIPSSRTQSLSDSEDSEVDPDLTIAPFEIKDDSDDPNYSDSDETLRTVKRRTEAKALSGGDPVYSARAATGQDKGSSHPTSASAQQVGFRKRSFKPRAPAPACGRTAIDRGDDSMSEVPAKRSETTHTKRQAPPAKRPRQPQHRLSREIGSQSTILSGFPVKNTRSQTAAGSASSSLLCHQCEVYHERNGILHCVSCERGMCPKCLCDRYHAYLVYAAHLLYIQTVVTGSDPLANKSKPSRRQDPTSTSAGLTRQPSNTSSNDRDLASEDSDANVPLINATKFHDNHASTSHHTLPSSGIGKDNEASIHLLDFQCPVCKAICNCANCMRGPYPKPETVRCKPTAAERREEASGSQASNGRIQETKRRSRQPMPQLSSEDDEEHDVDLSRPAVSRSLRFSTASLAAQSKHFKGNRPLASDQGSSSARLRIKFNGVSATGSGEALSAIERAEARRAAIDAETDYVPVVAARATPRPTSSDFSNAVLRFGSPPRRRHTSTSDISDSQPLITDQAFGTSASGRVRLATKVGQQLGKSPASMLYAAASAVPRIEGDQLIPYNSDEPVFTLPNQITSNPTGPPFQHDVSHDLSTMAFPFKGDTFFVDGGEEAIHNLSAEALGHLPDLVYQTGDDEHTTPSIPSPAEDSQPQAVPFPLEQQRQDPPQAPAFTSTDSLSVPLTLPHSPDVAFRTSQTHKSALEAAMTDKLFIADYFDSAALKSYIDDDAMSGYLNLAAFDDVPKQDEVGLIG